MIQPSRKRVGDTTEAVVANALPKTPDELIERGVVGERVRQPIRRQQQQAAGASIQRGRFPTHLSVRRTERIGLRELRRILCKTVGVMTTTPDSIVRLAKSA